MTETPTMWTVLSMLEWATDYFQKKEVKSPRFSIEWLLAHVLSVKRLDLYLSYDRPLSKSELDELRPMVKRRANHEPLQYISGETDFHRVKIKVQPGVLIPRQETEQLTELILQNHSGESSKTVIDIGTGSGCIPIALKNEEPDWKIYATDVSAKALEVARDNAEYNDVEIYFAEDDIFSPKAYPPKMKFDLIISNPPYILPSEKNTLDDEVVLYEPELALFCSSIQKIYRALENFAVQHISQNGTVYLELHENYAEEVKELFSPEIWNVLVEKDYENKNRFLIATKKQ